MDKNIEDHKYQKNRQPTSSCLLYRGPPHKPDRNILHTQSHDHLRLHHTLAHLLPRLPGLRNHLHLEVPQKQREPADGFDGSELPSDACTWADAERCERVVRFAGFLLVPPRRLVGMRIGEVPRVVF